MTAFIISALSSNLDRLNKPFNPLLGETYELQRDDYRIVCEQVSQAAQLVRRGNASTLTVPRRFQRTQGGLMPS